METDEGQIKRIVISRMERCRVCHRTYTDEDITVISRKPDMWMMAVECVECHAKNFVAAVLNEGDPAQAELALRRLSEGVRGRFEIAPEPDVTPADPVNVNDVLDMHSFLDEFEGDFKSLFRGPKASG